MNNSNYDQIFNFLNQGNIAIILIVTLALLVVFFLISRLLIKVGLFLLVFTFILDNILRLIPLDIYGMYPLISTIIRFMYVLGILNFAIKVFFRLRKNRVKKEYYEDKKIKPNKSDNPIKRFFSYTGSLPFLLMLLINILINTEDTSYQNILRVLTSLSFLFMVFTTLYNTYKKLDSKNINESRMRFDDLREFFKNDSKVKKNANRKILKMDNSKEVRNKMETIRLNKDEIRKEVEYTNKRANKFLGDLEKDLYDVDLVKIVNLADKPNTSIISLTNLSTGEKKTYKSDKPKVSIREDDEYKVDLEFENFNDYDYGRFIDLLLEYSENKNKYKFQLDLIPQNHTNSKIVLYDPSNLYELDKGFSEQFQGKNISMNFPKYKINFISEN